MNRRRPLVPPHHPPARRKPAWTSGDGAALRDTWWGIGGPSLHQSCRNSCVGWIVKNGPVQAVKVASWVLKEEKSKLLLSLVGFLKPGPSGECRVELWLQVA